jgi:hypothetical protein
VIGETPRAHQGPGLLRQRAPDRHRPESAEWDLAGFQDFQRRSGYAIRMTAADDLGRIDFNVRHASRVIPQGCSEPVWTSGRWQPSAEQDRISIAELSTEVDKLGRRNACRGVQEELTAGDVVSGGGRFVSADPRRHTDMDWPRTNKTGWDTSAA